MSDTIMILILAVSAIIGYWLMGRIDICIDRHIAALDKAEMEKTFNEFTET